MVALAVNVYEICYSTYTCYCTCELFLSDIYFKMENNMYVLHKKDEDESFVWHLFLTAKDGKTDQCKGCKQVLKAASGSTKGLLSKARYKTAGK